MPWRLQHKSGLDHDGSYVPQSVVTSKATIQSPAGKLFLSVVVESDFSKRIDPSKPERRVSDGDFLDSINTDSAI